MNDKKYFANLIILSILIILGFVFKIDERVITAVLGALIAIIQSSTVTKKEETKEINE